MPPDKEVPYKFNFTYGKASSPLPASNNIPYMVHFLPNGKNINILKVNKGSFNNYNITSKDTIIFNTGKLVKGENKSAIVVLGSNESLQNLKPKINVSAIINGKPVSGIIQPPNPAAPLLGIDPSLGVASLGASIGTVLDLPKKATVNILGTANEVIGTVEKGYHLFHTIYNDSFSCFRLQLTPVSTQDYLSPNYNVGMKNCSNHPERIILRVIGLPKEVKPYFSSSVFDIEQHQTKEDNTLKRDIPATIT